MRRCAASPATHAANRLHSSTSHAASIKPCDLSAARASSYGHGGASRSGSYSSLLCLGCREWKLPHTGVDDFAANIEGKAPVKPRAREEKSAYRVKPTAVNNGMISRPSYGDALHLRDAGHRVNQREAAINASMRQIRSVSSAIRAYIERAIDTSYITPQRRANRFVG